MMQITITDDDGRKILCSGSLSSYAEVERLCTELFGVAGLLWPEDSAEHDARIEAENAAAARAAPAPKARRPWVAPTIGPDKELTPFQQTVLDRTKAGATVGQIGAETGKGPGVVAMTLNMLQRSGRL